LENQVVRSLAKITVAVAPMALAIQLLKMAVARFVNMQTFLGVLVQFAVAAGVGFVIYFGVAALVRSEEAGSLIASFRRRLGYKDLPLMEADEVIEV
jgi:ABC-type Na+ efflux pump permease subunit